MQLPSKGHILITVCDVEFEGIIVFSDSEEKNFSGTLPINEIMILNHNPKPEDEGCWLIPKRYDHFENLFIDKRFREKEDYDGFVIFASFNDLASKYEPVDLG